MMSTGSQVPTDPLEAPLVLALLHELESRLEALTARGETGQIDLMRVPLPSGALEALRTWLGSGEIEASVKALGLTTIWETRFAGVWWIRHAKLSGETLTEQLEIALSPALLSGDARDLPAAVQDLRERVAALERAPSADPR